MREKLVWGVKEEGEGGVLFNSLIHLFLFLFFLSYLLRTCTSPL